MREIEFRAWNKEKNIIVYDNEDGSASYWDGVFSSAIVLINSRLWYESSYEFMQYIGIKDIHGKKVFEGDIVKTKTIIYNNCSRTKVERIEEFEGEIVWRNYGWCIVKKTKDGFRYRTLWLWNAKDDEGEPDSDTMEIIGNRWDNPEMAVIE